MGRRTRYFFSQDALGNWYQIPASLRDKWERLNSLPGSLELSEWDEFEEYRIEGGIEHITFALPLEETL